MHTARQAATITESYPQRLETVFQAAWEVWTFDGEGLDTKARWHTRQMALEAAKEEYVSGISDVAWLASTVSNLQYKEHT